MKTKPFFKVFLVIFSAVSLSGCYVPIVKKEITIPFIEKSPEKAMELSMEKMKGINDFEADLAFRVEIDMGDDKLGILSEDLRKRIVKYVNEYSPKVMGIDSELYRPGMSEEATPVLAGFPEKLIMDYKINMKVIQGQGELVKFLHNVDIAYILEGMSFSANLDILFDGRDVYFKFNVLPDMIGVMMAQEGFDLKGKWLKVDLEEFDKFKTDNAIMAEIDTDDFSSQKIAEDAEKFNALIKEHPLLDFVERRRDEQIGGNKSYHYHYTLNKDNLQAFVLKAIDLSGQKVLENVPMLFDKEDLKTSVSNNIETIEESSLAVYIDKKDYYLRKTDFSLVLDLGKLVSDFNEVGKTKAIVSGYIEYKSINQGIEIAVPTDYISVLDLVEQSLGEAREKARNARTLSNVRQLSTLVELHAVNFDEYPKDLSELEDYERFSAPEYPADSICSSYDSYKYISVDDQKGYEIEFCLEGEGFSDFSGGLQKMVTGGIYSKDLEAEGYEMEIDSDGDGLSDWDEIMIYKTDPLNPDTDGDGFTDGEEVAAGYNPNGNGRLSE